METIIIIVLVAIGVMSMKHEINKGGNNYGN